MSESAASSFSSSSSSPSARSLPPRPDLDKLRKEAKRLLEAIRGGDPAALARLDALKLPRDGAALHDAQLILAREYGFPSWRAMKEHVEAVRRKSDSPSPSARALLNAIYADDGKTVASLLSRDPSLLRLRAEGSLWEPPFGGTIFASDAPDTATTLLHYAAARNATRRAEILLAAGAQLEAQGHEGNLGQCTPLTLAAFSGADHLPIVRVLLAHGADPNAISSNGERPLGTAVRHGEHEIAQALIEAGAEITIHDAVGLGLVERVEQMLEEHPELIHQRDAYLDQTPIVFAKDDTMRALLRERGAKPTLIEAAVMGMVDRVAELVKKSPEAIDARDKNGRTALIAAAAEGRREVVQVLLSQGADVTAEWVEGLTAEVAAERRGHREIAEMIRLKGAPNGTYATDQQSDSAHTSETIKETTMNTSTTTATAPTCGVLAPQFLVDDLEASIAYYRDQLGFTVDFTYGGFYAGLSRGAAEVHLKHAAKTVADRQHRREHEHLDASVAVRGIDALYAELGQRGANIIRPLESRPWGTRDFYIADPDGYIISFGQ